MKQLSELELIVNQLHGKIPIDVMYLPRPATNYSGCYPKYFEKHLPRLLETDNYVHFFGGKAETGYRIDLNESINPDLVANVENLSMIESNSFEGGMADPPYTKEFAKNLYNCEYPHFKQWTDELSRIVKPNGLIGIMQNYIVPQIKDCKYEKIVIILLRIKQYPKIVTIQRKTKEDSRKEEGNLK